MPTRQMSWDEWHLENSTDIDACANAIFGLNPAYRSNVARMLGEEKQPILRFDIYMPDDTIRSAELGQYVVVIGGILQIMSEQQHATWLGAM